jgi:hypothetical protein
MPVSRAFWVVAPFLSLCLTACGEFEVVDPPLEISDKRTLAVVPFRDSEFANGFDSPRGKELAEIVRNRIQSKADFTVLPMKDVYAVYESADEGHASDEHAERAPPRARELAQRLHCDYVLMADVVHWGTKDDDMIPGGLLRGSASIDVSIYETSEAAQDRVKSDKDRDELPPPGKGRLALAKKRVEASFPREYGMAKYGTTDMTPEQIEDGLKNETATRIAWLVVSHSKDEEKKAEGK